MLRKLTDSDLTLVRRSSNQ